ncbi:hypothetical protein ACC689_34805, partial [Rhizobium ruizarguesonis]
AAFDYAPLPDTADEMVDNDGAVRPFWQNFLSHLSAMPEKDLAERFARGRSRRRRNADNGRMTA